MSKAKHTPGPWRVELQSGQQVGVHKFTHCVDCADDSIASLLTKADAHLIAAAPDLLEACKRLSDHASLAEHEDGTKWADGIDWHDVEQVRKAIAKAEGLTP